MTRFSTRQDDCTIEPAVLWYEVIADGSLYSVGVPADESDVVRGLSLGRYSETRLVFRDLAPDEKTGA